MVEEVSERPNINLMLESMTSIYPIERLEKIRAFLIAGGIYGRKQQEITHYMVHQLLASEIVEILESWRAKGWVDKFTVEGPHRPITMWRATERILEWKEE